MSAENARLSNQVAQVEGSQSLSAAQLASLTRLRNEFGQLQQSFKKSNSFGAKYCDCATACRMRQEEQEVMTTLPPVATKCAEQARVARLKQWLRNAGGEDSGTPSFPKRLDPEGRRSVGH